MANTYTLISSNVLSSSAASVTFSAIPSTYTDLVVRASARNTTTGSALKFGFNGSATSFSLTMIGGNGSAPFSDTYAGYGFNFAGYTDRSSDTASTFSSNEIYIPSYRSSTNKPVSSIGVNENNATNALIGAVANLWSNTSAITSIELAPSSGNFDAGSSFYLYGIKNS